MNMRYQLTQHSLRGGRKNNEDRVGFAERDNAALMVLGDGLGGHTGGALAAEILVLSALHAFRAIKQPIIAKPSAFLALTIMQAHRRMIAYGKKQTPPISPRTTCVLCLVQNGYAYWAHVGDSRLYHFRNGRLLKRTLDHTKTEQLHTDGLLTEQEMLSHPDKSRLLKCLGGNRDPVISLGKETALQRNDVLLICSDGLWESMPPDAMLPYLRAKTLEEGIADLLNDADDRRGNAGDNLSAVCLRWEDGAPTTLPLQPQSLQEADYKTLREEAQRAGAMEELKKKRTAPKQEPDTPLDDMARRTLADIDDFIKRMTPKRPKPK